MPTEAHSQLPIQASGLVEEFNSAGLASGWITGPTANFPVLLELWVNDLVVTTSRADDVSNVNSWTDKRSFVFRFKDAFRFMRTEDELTIRLNGEPLPIWGHGYFYRPCYDGDLTVEDLRESLNDGYVFDKYGKIQLSKTLDTEWQENVVGLYRQIRDVIKRRFGYEMFAFYGTLLGQVREGNFIDHDDDIDIAYMSTYSDGDRVAAELRDVAYVLIEEGFYVDPKTFAIRVHDANDLSISNDLYHMYFDRQGNLGLPFGRGSFEEFHQSQWGELSTANIGAHEITVPGNAEAILEHIYGENWKIPQQGLKWNYARKVSAKEARMSKADRESVYWANFYARNTFSAGSNFFQELDKRDDLPHTVLDIGCGDGRDSFAFAESGHHVIGVDRSHIGIDYAVKKSVDVGLSNYLSFMTCDVVDTDSVRQVIEKARTESGNGPILFYMRFFLHSIPKKTQDRLLRTISLCARRGDYIAAEFRTLKDQDTTKTYENHYRRYQSGLAFGRALREHYNYVILKEERGKGLSPYKGEDPHLYRVVARKGTTLRIALSDAKHFARKMRRAAARQLK